MDSFWKWFFKGVGGAPAGLFNILNSHLVTHVLVAALTSWLIRSDPFSFAGKALFPASSILIGLSMAWTTRASTILQTKELRAAIINAERPAEDYVYGFQLAILIVIVMVVDVAVMAGGGTRLEVFGGRWDSAVSGFCMYFLLSLALREC